MAVFNKTKNEFPKFGKTNINKFRSTGLLKQIEANKEEMLKQEGQINKINQKIKDIISIDVNQIPN
jgi:hypothetical protein